MITDVSIKTYYCCQVSSWMISSKKYQVPEVNEVLSFLIFQTGLSFKNHFPPIFLKLRPLSCLYFTNCLDFAQKNRSTAPQLYKMHANFTGFFNETWDFKFDANLPSQFLQPSHFLVWVAMQPCNHDHIIIRKFLNQWELR